MSEFKFACPVCGQHITADSANTGSQLECPTCYRKIVVPQAPTSTDPKFILSAAEANKPRPLSSVPTSHTITSGPPRTALPIVLALILVSAVLAGAAVVVFKGEIFGRKNPFTGKMTGVSDKRTNEDDQVSGKKVVHVPPPTNDIAWNLDPAGAAFPEAAVVGKLRGEFVSCNRSSLTGGALGFRQTTRGLPDLGVTIFFFARQPEELRGKTINITPNDKPAPRVTLRWKEGTENKTQSFTNGYALKLEMGDLANNRIPGKIYLSLPDEAQSRVAGTFMAEVRKPAPPRPRGPQPRSGN